jgi:hypothetical protein
VKITEIALNSWNVELNWAWVSVGVDVVTFCIAESFQGLYCKVVKTYDCRVFAYEIE